MRKLSDLGKSKMTYFEHIPTQFQADLLHFQDKRMIYFQKKILHCLPYLYTYVPCIVVQKVYLPSETKYVISKGRKREIRFFNGSVEFKLGYY